MILPVGATVTIALATFFDDFTGFVCVRVCVCTPTYPYTYMDTCFLFNKHMLACLRHCFLLLFVLITSMHRYIPHACPTVCVIFYLTSLILMNIWVVFIILLL